MSNASEKLQVRVRSMTYQAQGILSYELTTVDDFDLPPFGAGSHIDLYLPNGVIRSYSLLNDPSERRRYVVGVNKDPSSRGGSKYMHETLRPGDALTISTPRNNFPLDEAADRSVFIAGGIGITPILSMIRRLKTLGRRWTLYYCARTRKHAAFLPELRALAADGGGEVIYNYDGEAGGKILNLTEVIEAAPADAHLYCCGPLPMLEAFEKAAAHRPSDTVHLEYFAAKDAPALEGGFSVELARTGATLTIPPGKSILDAVLDAGVQVPYSCMEGICGSCETKVLEGVPEHRDLILSKTERAANKTMMICCSGCVGDRLVLDL